MAKRNWTKAQRKVESMKVQSWWDTKSKEYKSAYGIPSGKVEMQKLRSRII